MRIKPACCALVAALSCAATSARAAPSFQRVLVVMLENANYEDAVEQPFLKEFAGHGALLTNYHGVTHPSQPNYVALTGGTYDGVSGDGNVTLDIRHIGDLLEAKGKSWKAYAEGYPGRCFLGSSDGAYARKHVPFLSFRNVTNDASRCADIVDASEFSHDAAQGTLPNYSFFVPDLNDDGHDTGVAAADSWLSRTFGPLLKNEAFMKGTLVVITFDEDDFFLQGGALSGNHVYAALVGDSVAPGAVSNDAYDHFSLLRTIEDGLGLGTLGRRDEQALPITGIWR
jgi:phospholipase C